MVRLSGKACYQYPGAACRPSGRNKGGGIRRRRMPGDIRPEGLQVTSGPSDRGDLRDQTRGKRQEYCADFTSRFLANSPCSRPTPRARCRVTNSSSTPTRSEAHTSELQSLMRNSYDVVCLKKKKNRT